MTLTSENVEKVFVDCLCDGKNAPKSIEEAKEQGKKIVEGVQLSVVFEPKKIEEHREDIASMLEELPDEFKEGWSFLNMCEKKDGTQWTGFHRCCDMLVVLGIACDLVEFCLPRELWSAFAGGMPYIQIKTA